MPRSEEAEHFTNAVYAATQQIPRGKVTSYSHIACLLDSPKKARQVGIALKALPSADSGAFFHNENVPWQRVVNARGGVSPREPGGATRQAKKLREEGVTVHVDAMGELSIELDVVGWFPDDLPVDI